MVYIWGLAHPSHFAHRTMKHTLVAAVLAAMLSVVSAQSPNDATRDDTPAANVTPATPSETVRRVLQERWTDQYNRQQPYDFPCMDFRFLDVGKVGWAQAGKVNVRFEYHSRQADGDHLVIVHQDVYDTFRRGPGAFSRGSAAEIAASTGADRVFVGTEKFPILIDGELPADYERGEMIPLRADLVVTDRVRLPGYGDVYRMKRVEFPELPTHRAQIGIDVREWSDQTGRFSTTAAIESYADLKVELVKTDGESITVPIKQLSDRDQRYVRDWIKEQRTKEQRSKEHPQDDAQVRR